MSNVRCSYGVFFSFYLAALAAAGVEPPALIKCELQPSGQAAQPVEIKIVRTSPLIEGEDQTADLEYRASGTAPEPLQGTRAHFAKNILDLEKLDYDPLLLFGLTESDVAAASFYYVKRDPDARELDLILVSIFKTEQTRVVYAGSYGSYKGTNVLCPLNGGGS